MWSWLLSHSLLGVVARVVALDTTREPTPPHRKTIAESKLRIQQAPRKLNIKIRRMDYAVSA